MATLDTLLVNADSVNGPRQWGLQDFATIDEGIAAADGSAIGDDTNANATLTTSFLLSAVNADLLNVDTLSFQIRYRVIGAQTNTRNLHIRIVAESDGAILAALDSGGSFQTIGTITNTTFQNSAVTAFGYVNTAATKAQWDDARVEIMLTISKSMAGDTNGVRVDTLQMTGTYTASAATNVEPGTGALTLTGLVPTVTASDNQNVAPGTGALSLTGIAPTVTASDHQNVTPDVGALTMTGFAPTVEATNNLNVSPGVGALSVTGFAPTVTAPNHVNVTTDVGALLATGFAPTITIGTNVDTDTGQLTMEGFAPVVSTPQNVTPGLGALTVTGFAPEINIGVNIFPEVGELSVTGFSPTVEITEHVTVTPPAGQLVVTGFAPTVEATGVGGLTPQQVEELINAMRTGGTKRRQKALDQEEEEEEELVVLSTIKHFITWRSQIV